MLAKIEPSDQKDEKVNSALNVVVIPPFERARRRAEAADDARRRGDPLCSLHGVPITIKEQLLVKDTVTIFGMPHQKDHRAALRWGWEKMSAAVSARPAHFCEIQGLKPTPERFTNSDTRLQI